ncbi:MAG: hypothetical protein J6M40_01810 [Prevotella sp.]|jgi:hypothetical protein|nr:hypothetical protein [Prevotella sp.]
MVVVMMSACLTVSAVEHESAKTLPAEPDSIISVKILTAAEADSINKRSLQIINDTAKTIGKLTVADSTKVKRKSKRDWSTWQPDPKRAMWLAIVLPGAGQIYNQKYWKLPIIYGGFLGCAYAMRWNNQMYHDYSQAYLDIMDDDPNTQSYNQFLHLGQRIESNNEERFKQLFKKRKDYYRRYRDMSFFIMVGVYALSVIDAYVDASLAQFDISDDLSFRVAPSVINTQYSNNPLKSGGLGLQCSLTF